MKKNEQSTPIPEDNTALNQDVNSTSEENTASIETSVNNNNSEVISNNNEEIASKKKKDEKGSSNKSDKTKNSHKEVPSTEVIQTNDLSVEEEINIEQAHYDSLSKEELVLQLEELVKEADTSIYRKQIGSIKVAFHHIQKEENQHQLIEHTANGGNNEDFIPIDDELSKRFNQAFAIYKENKAKQEITLEAEKQKNLIEKQQIIEDLKVLIDSEEELKKTYDAFKDLQERWKTIGQVPQKEKNDLWQSYHFLIEKFFAKVKINKELKDLDLKKNFELKMNICDKTEELMLEPSIVKSFQLLQSYHESWKEVGPVAPDKKDEIWQRFSSATEKINQRRQEFYQKQREEQENNYVSKNALCEKTENLINVLPASLKEWQDKTDEVIELQKQWKTIGYAPKKVNNEVWVRFRNAINTFFDKKKEFYGKIKDEQTENYNLKVNICIQAEALKTDTNWKKTTDELIKLQQEWKKIGPVQQKFSDKIWKRFRAACDEFFTNKSAYFSNVDKNEEDNLKQKQDLIKKINEYQFGENNNENLEILKNFQREWSEIGHVPIKAKDAIQNEFRETINKQYDKLKISANEKVTLNYKSRIEHLKGQSDSKHIISKEINFISGKISSLTNDIMLLENNMGFFAKSKNADILKAELEKKIKITKNEISVLSEKLKLLKQTEK